MPLSKEEQQARKRAYYRRYKLTHQAQIVTYRAQRRAAEKRPQARDAAQAASALAQEAHRQQRHAMLDFLVMILLETLAREPVDADGSPLPRGQYLTAAQRLAALRVTRCREAIEWLNALRGKAI